MTGTRAAVSVDTLSDFLSDFDAVALISYAFGVKNLVFLL